MISIIIITKNAEEFILDCLNSLAKANGIKGSEILIVDANSTDSTKQVINEFSERHPKLVKLIKSQKAGYSTQRNLGLKKAKGKIALFISSDTTVDKRILNEFKKEEFQASQGRIINVANNIFGLAKIKSLGFIYQKGLKNNIEQASTVNLAIKKTNYNFNEKIKACEDKELFIRNNIKLSNNNGIVYHKLHENMGQFLSKVYKEAESLAILGKKYPKIKNMFKWKLIFCSQTIGLVFIILGVLNPLSYLFGILFLIAPLNYIPKLSKNFKKEVKNYNSYQMAAFLVAQVFVILSFFSISLGTLKGYLSKRP